MSNQVKLGTENYVIEGRFRLDVRRDPKKFSMTNILSFVPPGKTVNDRVKFKTEGSGEVDSLFINRHSILFDPNKEVDAHNIAVFIQHPDVRIGGMPEEDHQKLVDKRIKKANCTFTITNVDKVEIKKYNEEVSILKVRGKLYNEDKPIEIEKLLWICSNFGIPYFSNVTDKQKYVNEITRKVDKYIMSGSEYAKKVDDALVNMKRTEMIFYINELLNLNIISNFGGIFKIEDRPIGSTIDHLINFYEQNSSILLGHKKLVKDSLKFQGVLK